MKQKPSRGSLSKTARDIFRQECADDLAAGGIEIGGVFHPIGTRAEMQVYMCVVQGWGDVDQVGRLIKDEDFPCGRIHRDRWHARKAGDTHAEIVKEHYYEAPRQGYDSLMKLPDPLFPDEPAPEPAPEPELEVEVEHVGEMEWDLHIRLVTPDE